MSVFKVLQTPHAPQPIGTYSQATEVGGLIFISGQIGLAPNSNDLVAGGCQAQLIQIFENIQAILATRGGALSHLVKLTIYLTELSDFPLVNQVMNQLFRAPFPARAVVQVAGLPKQAAVEIEAIAAL